MSTWHAKPAEPLDQARVDRIRLEALLHRIDEFAARMDAKLKAKHTAQKDALKAGVASGDRVAKQRTEAWTAYLADSKHGVERGHTMAREGVYAMLVAAGEYPGKTIEGDEK